MTRPLRFLVLSPTPTWPLDHGNRKRVHQICSGLVKHGHEVHFLYYPAEQDWGERIPRHALAQMQRQWTSMQMIPVTRAVHPPPAGQHHALDEWWDPAVGDMLRWMFKVERFDALLVNYVWLSKAFEYCPPGVVRILDTHDRFGGRKELLQQQGLAPEFFYCTPEVERRGLDRAEIVLAIKEQEARQFTADHDGTSAVITLPYVEPVRHTQRRIICAERVVFGLLGARNSLNRRSAAALIAALRNRPRMQNMTLLLGGSLGDDFVASEHEGIEVLGRVVDIADFYDACDAVVVPLESSTGQKIRVGEALAYGVPVVSHAHAFEGYVSTDPLHDLRSVEAVADAMIAVTSNPCRLAELGRASVASHARQQAAAEDGFAALLAEVKRRRRVTVVAVELALLERSCLVRLRLLAAMRTAANWGAAVLWLAGPRGAVPSAGLEALLSSLPYECDVERVTESIGEPLAATIRDNQAEVLWTGCPDLSSDFQGRTIWDDVLSGLDASASSSEGVLRCAEAGATRQACYAPLLLGVDGIVKWREPSGMIIWLVTPHWSPEVAAVSAQLAERRDVTLRIWCETGAVNQSFATTVLDPETLCKVIDRPSQIFLFHPRSFASRFVTEVLAQSGAPCVMIDPLNAERHVRSADKLSGIDELQMFLDLFMSSLDLGVRMATVGRPIPIETFAHRALLS